MGRRKDGVPVCVEVLIRKDGLELTLATNDCGLSGNGKPLNSQEHEIVALWKKMQLNTDSFTGGNLIAFLNQDKTLV